MMRARAALAAVAMMAACAAKPSETEANRAIVTDFSRMFYDQRDVNGAFEKYVSADYIQHNPDIRDGREAAIAALEPMFSRPGARFDVKRILVDGDMAVIHLHGRGGEGKGGAVADIYRLKDGKIVEHWDVLQPIADKTVNPHPYF